MRENRAKNPLIIVINSHSHETVKYKTPANGIKRDLTKPKGIKCDMKRDNT